MTLTAGLFLTLFAALQEGPAVTIDKTAPLETLIGDLQRATGGRIRVQPDGQAVTVSVKAAPFFQALDAICRSHGGVTYFGDSFAGPDGAIEIKPTPWVEYPAVYSGPFRVSVSELVDIRQRSSLGDRAWARVMVVLFGPPWIGVSEEAGAKAEFVVLEARDADGKDVVPSNEGDPVQRVEVLTHPRLANYRSSNSARRGIQLRPFDLDRGLSVFRGKILLTLADAVDAALAPKVGESITTPAGTLTVDAALEHVKSKDGITWRIQMTLTPAEARRTLLNLLENRVGNADGKWWDLDLPKAGMSFEAVVGPLPHLPTTLVFRARKGERKVEVPFEFRKLTFKKG